MAIISKSEAVPRNHWSYLRNFFQAENLATTIVSILVTALVVTPLIALVVGSFLVLDDLGFSTEWGLENYREMFQGSRHPQSLPQHPLR